MSDREAEIAAIRARLAQLSREREELEGQLRTLATHAAPPMQPMTLDLSAGVHNGSSATDKVRLFRSLFGGRADVFPVRWENSKTQKSGYAPACANEWVRGVCGKPQVKCSECPNQAFIPVTDSVIEQHLRGESSLRLNGTDFVAGVYPITAENRCTFLAVDFDGAGWAGDALAFLDAARVFGVPAVLERSRSGDGAHVWIFFEQFVSAQDARQLGAIILTAALDRRPELGFASYDRLFPSQDSVPRGGFGNLIALPLQRRAREHGNSVFVDDVLVPFADQWAYLSGLQRLSEPDLQRLLTEAYARGPLLGVRMPVEDDDGEEPWQRPPSQRRNTLSKTGPPNLGPMPVSVRVVLANEVFVDRTELPPALVTQLARLAAFQNPEFYRAQAMRMSTFGKPRIVACATIDARYVTLPRGCMDEVRELLAGVGVAMVLDDQRDGGQSLDVSFIGELRLEQSRALEAMLVHDTGVLAATTAFGKTVVAAAIIARRAVNTLVLVHRQELLTQWRERLRQFLGSDHQEIGVIGGGKRKPTGRIDIALLQSLVRKGVVSDLIAGYGQLIVDECHHVSAVSFEQVMRRSKAKYVLGLSATVTRKDGHQPIIFMQCGPVRHRVTRQSQAASQAMRHRVIVRPTAFETPVPANDARVPMATLYAALAQDEGRNAMLIDDVLTALQAGRSPLVLTERRDHLEFLRTSLTPFVRHVIVLHGAKSRAGRIEQEAALAAAAQEERLLIATGRYIGEGFDDSRLDTLFLAMPISWRGTLAQYVGRLHRARPNKVEVQVYDYVDVHVPVLARMAAKRRAGYKAMGYEIGGC